MDIKKWEKSAERVVKNLLDKINIGTFSDVAVDVVPDNYDGYDIHITFLMDRPFKMDDSDFLQSNRHKIKEYLENFLPKLNNRTSFGFGTSTIDNYLTTTKPWYDKKKGERLQESLVKTLRDYNSVYDPEIISEASKKKVLIDKVGLNEPNAEYLDEVCGSLSVWMANKLIDFQLANMKSWESRGLKTELTKQNALEKLNSGNLKNYYGQKVIDIMDWVRVGLNGRIGEYKNLSIPELLVKSKEWHDSLGIGEADINYVEKNNIIKDFRDENGNGFYWAYLDTKSSPEEKHRMGHCGESRYGYIYSLRETKPISDKFKINQSHLTSAIGEDGIMYQLKGPKNSKPKEEFYQYILPLFYVTGDESDYLVQGFGTEYAAQQDFKLTDLPNEVLANLYQNRPELFNTRSLQKKLMDLGIIEKPTIDYNVTIKTTPEGLGKYIDGDWVYRKYKQKTKTPAGQEYERTVEVTMFEIILSGDVYELWDNWDADWKSSLNYHVDKTNEQKIRDLLKHIAQKDNPDFDEETFNNEDTEDLIEEWDDDGEIARAISNSTSNAESDDYANYLYKQLKNAVEEYGKIEKMDDSEVIFHVNAEPYIDNVDERWIDDYMERCDDDIPCVFDELVSEEIDKPKFNPDERWYPSVDEGNFNSMLSDYLHDVEYHYTKS